MFVEGWQNQMKELKGQFCGSYELFCYKIIKSRVGAIKKNECLLTFALEIWCRFGLAQVLLEQFPDYSGLTNRYDLNQDNLVAKEEMEEFEFILYPEKGDVSDTIRLADYFHMYDNNKDNYYDR